MKYTYILTINNGTKYCLYTYFYGNSAPIKVGISSGNGKLIAELSKDYSPQFENSYAEQLMKEGMKRLSLIHLMRYSRNLEIHACRLRISCGTRLIADRCIVFPTLYPLVNSIPDNHRIPDCWYSTNVINSILSIKKNAYESQMAALYAYITAKSKSYEVERFIYFWMAFNGYYNYIYPDKHCRKDTKKLQHAVIKADFGAEIIENQESRKNIGFEIMLLLYRWQEKISLQSLTRGTLAENIAAKLKKADGTSYNLTPYGYMLSDFAYYLRCSVIHANKPLPLFAFADDMEINSLSAANIVLENFLDKHLFTIFN